jgi:hypothetical protein
MKDQFYKINLDLEDDLFTTLYNSVNFEPVIKGRVGNHLVDVSGKGVPIVRTTTQYNIPANHFAAIHHKVAGCIPGHHFNNALIEVYGARYYKMNFHSDQALDLDNDSYIAVFSCYEHPEQLSEQHTRKLIVKDKESEEEFEIALTHHSVVLFSVGTNTKFLHKIVLDQLPDSSVPDNRWLGITFRQSKTFIRFEDGVPRFPDGQVLTLANKDQEKEFFQLRGQENRSLAFTYPELNYTVNVADTMRPV